MWYLTYYNKQYLILSILIEIQKCQWADIISCHSPEWIIPFIVKSLQRAITSSYGQWVWQTAQLSNCNNTSPIRYLQHKSTVYTGYYVLTGIGAAEWGTTHTAAVCLYSNRYYTWSIFPFYIIKQDKLLFNHPDNKQVRQKSAFCHACIKAHKIMDSDRVTMSHLCHQPESIIPPSLLSTKNTVCKQASVYALLNE